MSPATKVYEVAIIGAGVSGTSLLYVLSHYTNLSDIILIEKEQEVACVNSHRTSNSQTLHFGDIETNYTLEKARNVNRAASLVKNYLLRYDRDREIYSKYHKMVLAVGREQTDKLRARYEEFKELFPDLRIIERSEIEQLEPNVLKGRESEQEILALFTPEGYALDFQKLSQSFLQSSLAPTDRNITIEFGQKVRDIQKKEDGYRLVKENGEVFLAKAVAVMAGAHSLLLAKSLGYGQHYALLCVAGSFYLAPQVLQGKVYTVQLKKLPFAAIHGDPEVDDSETTRFGPTAKVLPLLERYRYRTLFEYLRTAGLSIGAIASFLKILSDPFFLTYIIKNFIYDLPWIGKRLFIQEVKKIVPSIQLSDLSYARGYGGIRPQIVNLKTQSLELGEAKIIGDNILFNITPSPGASTCLQNAREDTERLISFLGCGYQFDRKAFEEALVLDETLLKSPV
ncbi:MAG: FAD-dependent oxidoreductase [Cyanobacteriota bacterium]|nr:FAD-dependent oxidoreductase [Cyanobacteriota bacterium]